MNEAPKHTPRPAPWKYYYGSTSIWTADDHHAICVMMGPRKNYNLKAANADIIVRAVNCHDEMLATLKDAANRLRGAGMLAADDEILTTIAKASGEPA